MSKASEWVKHFSVRPWFQSGVWPLADVSDSGNCRLLSSPERHIEPETAVAFGRWLIETFEEKARDSTPPLPVIKCSGMKPCDYPEPEAGE